MPEAEEREQDVCSSSSGGLLSSVTRTAYLDCLTDLHAIRQVHLWGPITHCARCGSLTPRASGDFGG